MRVPKLATKFLIAFASVTVGYFLPSLQRTTTPVPHGPTILIGQPNYSDPKLSVRLDLSRLQGESAQDVLRKIAEQAGLQLDVDWNLVHRASPYAGERWISHGTAKDALDLLFPPSAFSSHPWIVQAGTFIMRDPMPPVDAGAVVRVYDISPILSRLNSATFEASIWYDWKYNNSPISRAEMTSKLNEAAAEKLCQVTYAHIDPALWRGAHNSWLKTVPGFLIVSATPDVQARIERFIGLINGEQ